MWSDPIWLLWLNELVRFWRRACSATINDNSSALVAYKGRTYRIHITPCYKCKGRRGAVF